MNMKCIYRLLLGSAQLVLSVCVFLFVVVPLIFRFSYTLQRSMLFLNFGQTWVMWHLINIIVKYFINNNNNLWPTVRWPRNFNYSAPEKAGLSGTRNFYLTTDDGVKLGVWLVLQNSRKKNIIKEGKQPHWISLYEHVLFPQASLAGCAYKWIKEGGCFWWMVWSTVNRWKACVPLHAWKFRVKSSRASRSIVQGVEEYGLSCCCLWLSQ